MLIAGLGRGIDIDRLAHAMLEAHWRDDADLADRPTLAAIGRAVGVYGNSLLDGALTPEVQQVYTTCGDRSQQGSLGYGIAPGSPTGASTISLRNRRSRARRGFTTAMTARASDASCMAAMGLPLRSAGPPLSPLIRSKSERPRLGTSGRGGTPPCSVADGG